MSILNYLQNIKLNLIYAEFSLEAGNIKGTYQAMGSISDLLRIKEEICGEWLDNVFVDRILNIFTIKYMELYLRLNFQNAWTTLAFYEVSIQNAQLIDTFNANNTMNKLILELTRQEKFAKKHDLLNYQLCDIQPYLNISSQLAAVVSCFQQLNSQVTNQIDLINSPTYHRRKSSRVTEIKSPEQTADTELSNSQRSLMKSANQQLVINTSGQEEIDENLNNQSITGEVSNQPAVTASIATQDMTCQNIDNKNNNQDRFYKAPKSTASNQNETTQAANPQYSNHKRAKQTSNTNISNQQQSNQPSTTKTIPNQRRKNKSASNQSPNQTSFNQAPTPQPSNYNEEFRGTGSQVANHLNPLHKNNKQTNNRYRKFHHPDNRPNNSDEVSNSLNNNLKNF